jgi:DNA repair protein RadA/Sms
MAKSKNTFQCDECGALHSKWAGQCPECQAWNSIRETRVVPDQPRRYGGFSGQTENQVHDLASLTADEQQRISVNISELDRVLGGGLVPGSVLLLGGDPGIGKSTLLLQLTAALAGRVSSLYVTGEESLDQVSMRARRLGLELKGIRCLAETAIERILAAAAREKPGLLIVDSIQTVYSGEVESAPGSISQVRESAAQLVRWAKENHCAVVLVGHVTKEGSLAGPRILEHMVDAVLYFESDTSSRYRVIRAVKNRFGAVNELGMFAMTGIGLKEVTNPSAIFLAGHSKPVPGSVITIIREGTRPILIEVQALVAPSHLANPRRVSLGLEQNRLAMMLAVLHRHCGVVLADQDVFINVVGGIRVSETAADLPMLLALNSSFRDRPLPASLVCFGEVGLSGEIRPVADGQDRLKAAVSHGYQRVIIPHANKPRQGSSNLQIIAVRSIDEAISAVAELEQT